MRTKGTRFQILAVPTSDLEFRAAVIGLTEGIDPDGPAWTVIVADKLRSRYPQVAIVEADPLGAVSELQRWYVLRNGDRGSLTVRRILVIDDDPSARDILADVFDAARFVVQTAASGQEALDLIELWPPDLILVDLRMPFMTGDEFAALYRASASPQPAPLVVVSGARDAIARAAEMGARSVVVKPFDLDLLVTLVERYA
ncbi:MAG: response regulator [Candidatus Limnocylindrales bacterium]